MKRLFRFVCGLLMVVGILSGQPKQITILHTNDIHASFVPHEAFWMRQTPKPMIGGFVELAAATDSIRHLRPVILVDAGDLMTGNPITDIVYHGGEGGALYEMMNIVDYDAATAGNHDFDISKENFIKNTRIARYPMVSANLVNDAGEYALNMKDHVILERNGLKIGIIGVMSSEFYTLVNQNSIKGIKLLPNVETVQKEVDQVTPQSDLVVLVSHCGVDEDSVIAMKTHGLNVIVGGHSHTRLRIPKVVNGVIIVQTGANCENLGVLDLTVDNHKVTKYDGKLLPLWYNSARPRTPLSRFVDSLNAIIDKEYSQVIGTLTADWKRGGNESAIGHFIADAQREGANTDVGFMNVFGIRKDVPAGPMTKRDLFEVLPFRNVLCTFQLSGKQLREIVVNIIENGGAIVSGIDCEWKRNRRAEVEFASFLVNGKPLEDDRTYTGAGSDYMLGEAKKYLGIDVPKLSYTDKTVFQVVEQKVRAVGTIKPINERRIRNVK